MKTERFVPSTARATVARHSPAGELDRPTNGGAAPAHPDAGPTAVRREPLGLANILPSCERVTQGFERLPIEHLPLARQAESCQQHHDVVDNTPY